MKSERDYLYYETINWGSHDRRCIDGHITGSNKCVGYCEFCFHSGYLTEKLREKKDCLEKGCNYYLPKIKLKRPEKVAAK